ncbi:LAQU0S17e01266g1_1 [Lachancea quebecensis]|uniref:LAQU0S17e01266g1_1 n=1 Tax=Lachancea quebecensis TaxID=1654605 RepID=A0A0P1KYS4_9SACH|nr:LAQU0S17e01266g1_1 [Lachancea quebecensis]
MSDNVERRKSQRWVSVSKGSYDGKEWDSSDEDGSYEAWENENGETAQSPKRSGTVTKLPPLPKLQYGKDVEDASEENNASSAKLESTSANLDQLMSQISHEMTPRSESRERFSSNDGTPKPRKQFSDEGGEYSSGFSYSDSEEELQVSKTGYFSNMVDIPQSAGESFGHSEDEVYVTPDPSNLPQATAEPEAATMGNHGSSSTSSLAHVHNPGPEEADTFIDDSDSKLAFTTEVSETPRSKENSASRSGGQSASIESDNESPETDDSPSSALSSTDEAHVKSRDMHSNPESFQSSQSSDSDVEADKETLPKSAVPHQGEDITGQQLPHQFHETPTRDVRNNSSDEYGDNESFFNHYGNNSSQSSPANNPDNSPKKQDPSPLKLRQSSKTQLSYENLNSQTINEVSSDNVSTASEPVSFKFKDRVRDSILESSDEDIGDDESVLRVPTSGYYAKMLKDTSQAEGSDGQSTETEGSSIVSSETDTGSITKSIDENSRGAAIPSEDDPEGEHNRDDRAADTEPIEEQGGSKSIQSRQSINLGKWQPDTDSTRAAFLGEARPEVPEGFVIDQDGNMINVNPSSMRSPRVVSTYSEAESAWNAFPASGNAEGDLDTIYDTKTIYDNQTIYNVPGIATNNSSLPPLPNDISALESTDSAAVTDSDSILNHLSGEKKQHFSSLKENFSIHSPNSEEIAQVRGREVPAVNLDSLISAKGKTHAMKINDLKNHSRQLDAYDTGLHTWINYALKNSSSDKDYIFQDYKVNKHVRDAYAQADELSKKMTVSNTVANVNQNVSHLKRKVFSHTMKEKSKGLFSSIGKKKA